MRDAEPSQFLSRHEQDVQLDNEIKKNSSFSDNQFKMFN